MTCLVFKVWFKKKCLFPVLLDTGFSIFITEYSLDLVLGTSFKLNIALNVCFNGFQANHLKAPAPASLSSPPAARLGSTAGLGPSKFTYR